MKDANAKEATTRTSLQLSKVRRMRISDLGGVNKPGRFAERGQTLGRAVDTAADAAKARRLTLSPSQCPILLTRLMGPAMPVASLLPKRSSA
jgi:hypothetical protein